MYILVYKVCNIYLMQQYIQNIVYYIHIYIWCRRGGTRIYARQTFDPKGMFALMRTYFLVYIAMSALYNSTSHIRRVAGWACSYYKYKTQGYWKCMLCRLFMAQLKKCVCALFLYLRLFQFLSIHQFHIHIYTIVMEIFLFL